MSEPLEGASRRALIVAAATGMVVATTPALAKPRELQLADLKKEADVACVYHCDFGDPQRFAQMVTNISNHYSVYGADPFAIQLALVAHGQGIKFFLSSLEGTSWRDETQVPKLFDNVRDVAKNGLRVHLCEITFNRMKIDKSLARDVNFISFVPSGVATVAALQGKGFAYMKTG